MQTLYEEKPTNLCQFFALNAYVSALGTTCMQLV